MKTIPQIKPTKKIAAKIVELLSHGLVSGVGEPIPGQMCVEAAVCLAMGLPHGDEPKCGGGAVRAFKIRLNDCAWPSNQARADGMKRLAVAQLGSDTLDQMAFGKLMYLRGVQKILPFIWRKEIVKCPANKKAEMQAHIKAMGACVDFESAGKIARDASACFTFTFTSDHGFTPAFTSAFAFAFASDFASALASALASASALACPSAATYRHELLLLTAQVGLDALIEMKSPGCKWLSLCE